MLFTELARMLPDTQSALTLIIARNGDQLHVSLTPKHLGDDTRKGLATPLAVTGTPAELDAEFCAAVTRYQATRQSVADGIAAAEADLKQAEAVQKAKAEEKKKSAESTSKPTAKKPTKPAPKPAAKPAAPKPAPAAASAEEPVAVPSEAAYSTSLV